jgi:peptide/nickel transport system substrate-binding protein
VAGRRHGVRPPGKLRVVTTKGSWARAALAMISLAAGLAAGAGCRAAGGGSPHPVRLALKAAPLGLDPHLHNESRTYSVLANVFEALTSLDATLGIRPGLADSWTSPDEATWRFHLRPGVRFHDGRPLTSRDVVFSLERARRHPRSEFASYLVAVKSVRAVDATTVDVVTYRPCPTLLSRLAFVVVVPEGSPETIEKPVGTGPYRVAQTGREGELVLRAFGGYWGPMPAESEVVFVVVPEGDEGVRRIRAGQVDVLTEATPEEAAALGDASDVRVFSAPSPSVDYLSMRFDEPPFGDRRVRRAISLALDREALVKALVAGRGEPAGQLVSPSVFGFDPEIRPPRRDVAEARRLLAEAGYGGGIDVTLEFRSGRRLEPIREQLADAGIRVRLAPQPWAVLLKRRASGEARFSYGTFLCDSGDASDLFDGAIHSRDTTRGFGDSNRTGYANPELDELIEAAGAETSLLARQEALHRCMRLVLEDQVLVPILVRDGVYAARLGVTWKRRVDGRVPASDLRREPAP